MEKNQGFFAKIQYLWQNTSTEAKIIGALTLLVGVCGGVYAASDGGGDQRSARKDKCDDGSDAADNSDTESSYDAGYAQGASDGFWGNSYSDHSYASDTDAYSSGYGQGYEDGPSKESA